MQNESVRRIVTGHNAEGRAVAISDDRLDFEPNPSGASRHAVVWATVGAPVDNDDPTDGRDRNPGLTLPGGTVIRVLDMLPGKVSPMHRTDSLDYGIVISGSIELLLDDGYTTTVGPGDVVVQRGTIHAWRNPSDTTSARVAFVLLDATPATVDGVPLPGIHPAGAPTPEA